MRSFLLRAAAIAAAALAASSATDCTQQPISVSVRSLEQAGGVAFWCLSADKQNPGAWIDTCSASYPHLSTDTWNHMYALVTQPIRGEVALIDVSAGSVVDLDVSKPGFNFIPVGGNPGSIVSTPGGTAAFVGIAQSGYEGIWVVPSRTVVNGPANLTSFAACALPSAPGAMQVIVQPTANDIAPTDCAGNAPAADHPQGDISLETKPHGVRKLVVALPDDGALAIIDAQTLLDHEPGSFRECPIERYVPLQAKLPPSWPNQVWPQDIADARNQCWLTAPIDFSPTTLSAPRPAAFAFDAPTSTLYVTDEDLPIIHALDLSDPCNVVERDPLLPRSAERPDRQVVTREIAVSPVTSDGKKFVYAVDFHEGSVMAFDVSLGTSDRTPLIRKNLVAAPFTPPDRISLAVPVKSVQFGLRDYPLADPVTGVALVGAKCDPSNDTSVAAGYRTTADFLSGARPRNLRGVFAYLALTNGQIVVVDVDDFDASCRRPQATGACSGETFPSYQGANGELSCNMVQRHEIRSATFFDATEASGSRVPSMQSYPLLSLDSSVLPTDDTLEGKKHPRMLVPTKDNPLVMVGGRAVDEVQSDPKSSTQNMVMFDYRDPRAHYEQDWGITYEGSLPGFAGHVGRLEPASDSNSRTVFWDPSAYFCDRGVHDLDAARKVAVDRNVQPTTDDPTTAETWARSHLDVLQITSGFLDERDPYWGSVGARCSLLDCRESYGLEDAPKTARDLPIAEAYQNHLVVEGVDDLMRCCFPFLPIFTVRASSQWIVSGSASGFLHKGTTEPATGRCIDSCDPVQKLFDGRAYELPQSLQIPTWDAPLAFRNPILQFVLWSGEEPSKRNMSFSFHATNGFFPLLISLGASTSYVQPQSMVLVPQFDQLAVTDGSTQGLIFVDLASLSVVHTYY